MCCYICSFSPQEGDKPLIDYYNIKPNKTTRIKVCGDCLNYILLKGNQNAFRISGTFEFWQTQEIKNSFW